MTRREGPPVFWVELSWNAGHQSPVTATTALTPTTQEGNSVSKYQKACYLLLLADLFRVCWQWKFEVRPGWQLRADIPRSPHIYFGWM